jgi:hypothetical protein
MRLTEGLSQLQLELVLGAVDTVQQSIDEVRAPLANLRADVINIFIDYMRIQLHAGLLPHLRTGLTSSLKMTEDAVKTRLVAQLAAGAEVGAAMVGEVLASVEIAASLPSVSDLLHAAETLDSPALYLVDLFFENLQRDIFGVIYQGILTKQMTSDILAMITGLMPSNVLPNQGRYTWRLASIAKTEVGRAVSEGTQAMLDAVHTTVTTLNKKWVRSSPTGRPGHQTIEGTIVHPNQTFLVGPGASGFREPLRFPRDAAGIPHNTANCGCFIVPTLEDVS